MPSIEQASEAEVAWAAGLFEGEVCIIVKDRVILDLRMNDKDVVAKFHSIVGGRLHGPYMPPVSSGNRKPFWNWQCGYANEVEQILQAFQPWLGKRRSKRALEALEVLSRVKRVDKKQKPLKFGSTCKNGHKLNAANLARRPSGRRYCRSCARDYEREKKVGGQN